MKKFSLKSRVNIFATLSTFAYVYLMCSIFSQDIEVYKIAAIQGWNSADKENSTVPLGELFYFTLKPKTTKGLFYFPETIENQNLDIMMAYRPERIKIIYPEGTESPLSAKIWKGLAFLLGAIQLLMWIMIPVIFFRLLKILKTGVFFDLRNVECLRKMGWATLIAYVSNLLGDFCLHRVYELLFAFKEYDIVWKQTEEILLVIGFVILIFAEVLNNGIELKKEQELTI